MWSLPFAIDVLEWIKIIYRKIRSGKSLPKKYLKTSVGLLFLKYQLIKLKTHLCIIHFYSVHTCEFPSAFLVIYKKNFHFFVFMKENLNLNKYKLKFFLKFSLPGWKSCLNIYLLMASWKPWKTFSNQI
jgi:hypothetical protein